MVKMCLNSSLVTSQMGLLRPVDITLANNLFLLLVNIPSDPEWLSMLHGI